jgi:hypothetical protein
MASDETAKPAPAAAPHQTEGSDKPASNFSLLDQMIDGREYESLIDAKPLTGWGPAVDLTRAIREIEKVRGRACVA